MFDDEIVAIGTGINANDNVNVETTIDNRLLRKREKLKGASTATEYTPHAVYAIGNDGNIEDNVLDDDLDTRWSYEATENAWLTLELDDVYEIGYVGIAFHAGDERQTDVYKRQHGNNTKEGQ